MKSGSPRGGGDNMAMDMVVLYTMSTVAHRGDEAFDNH